MLHYRNDVRKMNEKIKHFSLLTVSTLIMAVGTYFFKFTYRLIHGI